MPEGRRLAGARILGRVFLFAALGFVLGRVAPDSNPLFFPLAYGAGGILLSGALWLIMRRQHPEAALGEALGIGGLITWTGVVAAVTAWLSA